MNKIEHIGIAVKNLEASNELFAQSSWELIIIKLKRCLVRG